ncbi:S9 family peptidase [Aquabacterium sp. OR-4]|uniref:S9 family peptidase n=1 Tax=Aquabacterium sp. OR-4 TaxID=2978127 RepID=UPI0028C72C9C|nr:prolyl oligopeptidase family serine peptidase [Aquabacterium sp. OR-4]MDT7833715.1 prolyl oligopeptidase family serine peptidase [Aquabacterium sp. OR-4]
MTSMHRRSLLALATATLATRGLVGCASATPGPPAAATTPTTAAGPWVTPPAALHLRQVPPVPQAVADAVARYTDFAGHTLLDWHPQRREMLVSHRPAGAAVAQLMRLGAPAEGGPATPEGLLDSSEPVASARYAPDDGRFIVFSRAQGGNEAYQLWRLDAPGQAPVLLTHPEQRHTFEDWLPGQRTPRALVSSVPLDRTAQGGRRENPGTRLWLLDPLQPATASDAVRPLAELPGTGWDLGAISPDGRLAAMRRYISATDSELWLLDLADGQRRLLLPQPGAPRAVHHARRFSPDGRQLYLTSDRGSEFRQLWRLSLADSALQPLSADTPWDVDEIDLSPDGRRLALRINIDGRDELRLMDAASGRWLPTGALPGGSVVDLRFHPARPELAFAVNGAQGPSQLWGLRLGADGTPAAAPQAWSHARLHPALDVAAFSEPEIVRWKSFDGRSISGLLQRPPSRFAGRRPVLIHIHGGPEGQAKVVYGGRNNHYVQDLGMALLRPNVRGSTGYGKTFLSLDNGLLREDSVKDIGALLDWIASQPDLDPTRVVVAGGSYGGYMSLAVATHYASRIAGSIDVVGISHFVSFLENTESYRRDLRRVEYGDERDPAMRAFLHRISPLTNARRITQPLFVVQGANDPRVPVGEAEQIVAQAQANGKPVWYLRAANEGHGFARKENADYQFYATVMFLRQVLGLD